jgi:intein-encoded DNA endonuclease-like protein
MNDYITKTDLKEALEKTEERLIEAMRKMQTELLRGFERINAAQNIRIRKVEADQSNLEAATSPRLVSIEEQLADIQIRLLKLEGPQ